MLPREVFKTNIQANAASVPLAHDQRPNGDPTPSAEDRMVTRQLNEAGVTIGIEVLDHVVVGDADQVLQLQEVGRMESGSMAGDGAGAAWTVGGSRAAGSTTLGGAR